MMISHRSWLSVTAVVAAAVAFSAACSSGGGSKKTTATPTPLNLAITNYYSTSGGKLFHPGECAGLKVTDSTKQLNQNTVMFVVDTAGNAYQFVSNQQTVAGSVLAINATAGYMTIGGGDEYPCITWGLDANNSGTTTKWAIDVISPITSTTTASGMVADAIEFDPNPLPPGVQVLGTANASGSNTDLGTVHDNNYWHWTAGTSATNRAVFELTSTDTSNSFTPFQQTFTPDYATFLNAGFDAAIQSPVHNTPYLEFITNYWGGSTEHAWQYTVNVTTNGFLTANSGADTCALATVPVLLTSPVYFVGSNNAMTNDYDPQGNLGCTNYYFKWFSPYTPGHPPITLADGDGVFANGKDSVFLVTVPGHKTLIAAMQGANDSSPIDSAIYVLPDTGNPATDCPVKPANCLSANDTFGVVTGNGGTDGLHWYNASATPTNVYVVVDSFGTSTSPAGTGKWVLFMDAK